jgi:hypothetical protein
VGKEPETTHAEARGPVPAAAVATAAAEPQADSEDGGGWFGWLTGRVQKFFGSLSTTDPGVVTSAGQAPTVNLTGDADPAQNAQHQQAASEEVGRNRTEAHTATLAPFGEDEVAPTIKPEVLRATAKPGGPAAPGGSATAPDVPPVAPDLLAQFDATATPELSAEVRDKAAQQREQRAQYEQRSLEAQREGQRQIAESTAATTREQEGLKDEARADVAGERKRWQDENKEIERTYGKQASARRSEIDTQISTKVETANRDAGEKLATAEEQAAAEKQKAEAQAAEKKRDSESKPKSWWERAKGAVSDAFDAIKGAVTAIFDGLRKLVKQIIEAAKSAVRALIDAARDAITGLIKGFGEFVKGLVSIALAAFPEAAARARAWIDRRVDQACDAVNRAADALKAVTDAILDGIGRAVDAALSVMHKAFMLGLDALEFLAKGPLEVMELLAKFGAFMAQNGQFLKGAQKVKDDPDSVLGAMKAALGTMIAEVPGKAIAAVKDLAGNLGARAQKHIDGIGRHLEKGLNHLKESWWEELKSLGRTLLWPWPTVFKAVGEIWGSIKACASAAYHLDVSTAVDEFIKIEQGLNTILGAVYGWFFIASVLIGTIIGAFFGGAGAIPGALAGAAFAGEVGEGLALAMIAVEAQNIAKAAVDIATTDDDDEQKAEAAYEKAYDRIAGSTLTIAIVGALIVIGEIAAQLARAIWEAVAGLFKEKPPAVSGGPKVGEPKTGEPKVGEPKTGEPKTGEPKVEEPKTGEPKVEEPKTGEPKVDEPKVDEPKVDEPKTDEPKTDEPKTDEPAEQYAACFLAGTLVDLGGATREIETVAPGDLVLARPADGEDEEGLFPVAAVHRNRTSRVVQLRIGEDELRCTPGHPFSVIGRGWVAAVDLRADDVLESCDGSSTVLTAVDSMRVAVEATTFNFEVQTASTYFVRIGARSVLVHNGGPDPNYDRVLYWLLGKGPNLRPTDTDGLSTWKTTSRAEVEKLMEARVNIDGRSPKDPHSFYTPEQLESAGIKPEPTPGEGTLAELGLEHNSLRPAEVANPEVPLTEEQMGGLNEKLGKAGEPTRVKPKDLNCG